MFQRSLPTVLTALLAVLSAGCQPPAEPVAEARPGAAVPVASADSIRYPHGAAQLEMIRTEAVAESRLPAADALNARVTYDDDRTARIGVGYAGRIVALRAAPGQIVKAGQVLAEIDSPEVGSALADARKAEADEARKQRLVDRARDLVAGDAVSQRDWEALQADLAVAHAETLRTAQRMQNLNPQGAPPVGERIRLVSPIAGVVAERNATPALEVGPGSTAPLFVVTDPRRLGLLIDVQEKWLGRLRQGHAVEVRSDAFPGERFAARLVQVGPVVDVNTRRVTARATLDNPEGKLLPEMFVQAMALQPGGRAVRIPNGALVNRGLYSYVYVASGDGAFERRRVTLLAEGGDESVVSGGLVAGERVVVRGALLLDADLAGHAGEKS